MSIRSWFELFADRRRSSRIRTEALVAHYWTGAVPEPREVRDIGISGAYIIAPDKFYPATLLQIIFEDQSKTDSNICICAQVCRKTGDGFCVSFLFGNLRQRSLFRHFLATLKLRIPGQTEATAGPEPVATGRNEIRPAAEAETAGDDHSDLGW
jgi:hypothetical protein